MRILYSRIELDPDSIELDESNTLDVPIIHNLDSNSTAFLMPTTDVYNKIAYELNNSDIAYTRKPIKLIKK